MTTPHVAVLPGKGLPSDSAQQDPNEGKDEPTKVSDVLEDHLKVLKSFDFEEKYGPRIGITRRCRWDRAKRLGLDPPIEVLDILNQYPETPKVQECFWSTEYGY
ncbi:DNA polymerase delta subunit 4-like [Dysidea avara]|uniref:DNA polymerase delta subunit 4-like n=1 Tax=Dysidea avara TaxID=196820 RepID=UPI0033231A82